VSSASTVLGGPGDNWCMVEIWWHRRETRRQTENTNFDLQHQKELGYSTDKVTSKLNLVCGESAGKCPTKWADLALKYERLPSNVSACTKSPGKTALHQIYLFQNV
jgi:hypothetical protein